MSTKPVPVNEPLLDGNERKYLLECIDTGWISSEGPFVRRFEDEFARCVGRRFGVAVSSGSAALDAAVVALGIGPDDEVIMPAFTIISCAAAIVRAGAVPVLVDSDPLTWNIDVAKIEQRLTNKTKAIMVVHIYGLPTDMDPILDLACRYSLLVIEDAAQMHGQTYRSRQCGSFGAVSTFSFYPNKHVTAGEGGMIVTDDSQVAERCRSLRNLCFKPEQRFVHDELGWNFRMTSIQAALGVAQLERLDEVVEKKRSMGRGYRNAFAGMTSIELTPDKTDYADNIYWVFGMVLSDEVAFDAREAMRRLGELGVGTRPFFWPMHEQPALRKRGLFGHERYPVAERLARRGFYIPSGVALTPEQLTEVASRVRKVLQ